MTKLLGTDCLILAHKFILCARFPVFKAMLISGLSESTSNEIVISDFSAEAIRVFVSYLTLTHAKTVVG